MYSLWDLLPDELQIQIIKIVSAILIQETYMKNREWYFLRKKSIKRKCPNYDGKKFRNGDRVLITRKDYKKQYGTITSISYSHRYKYRITLLTGKRTYFYEKENYNYPKDVVRVKVLNPWRYCVCNLCKKCDLCLLENLQIKSKGVGNFVTNTDLKVESIILETLSSKRCTLLKLLESYSVDIELMIAF